MDTNLLYKRYGCYMHSSEQSTSWIMKNILKLREQVSSLQEWNEMVNKKEFCTRKKYGLLTDYSPDVGWYLGLKGKVARALAVQVLWLACQYRLPTNSILCRFGMLANQDC